MTQNASLTLRSDRLAVDLAWPGTAYRRTRFDWTGFITQVTLDGRHTFCAPEDPDPHQGTGGVGLCSEFGNEKAIGFEETQPGQPFPKPGIGLLLRPSDDPYNFFIDHEISQVFPMKVESGEDWARFTVEPVDCRGYAFREVKEVRVAGNELVVQVRLENTGTQAIHTHEYCHNFMAIDQFPVGPNYLLRFAYPVRFEKLTGVFRRMLPPWARAITPDFILDMIVKRKLPADVLVVNGREITWSTIPTRPFFNRLAGFERSVGPQWELVHLPTGVGMSETDDFDPARVVIWGTGSVVSAEVYVDIDVNPGQSKTWTRTYRFKG